MKKLSLLILLTIMALADQPKWLYNIQAADQNEIIGYGADKDLSAAKQGAIDDITKSISVQINSSTDISQTQIDGKYKENISNNLQISAKSVLNGIKVLKAEQKDGIWYVASSYDNSPLHVKMKKLLPKQLTSEIQNSYLEHTPLFVILNGFIKTPLDYKLIRKDNLWQLEYKDVIIPLKQDEFYKLFSTQSSSKALSMQPNKELYVENDDMYFHINSSKEGYLSILYVEHNGKVGILASNLHKNGDFTFPDPKSEELFKVTNPYGETIQELYVVIYSATPLQLSEFENVSDNLLDESNYNFQRLVEKLNGAQFSTALIKIRKTEPR